MAQPTEEIGWGAVEEAAQTAKAISFDGCHKIYMLMDNEQVDESRGYGYGEDGSFLLIGLGPDQMVAQIKEWYADSCGLRFVNTVHTNHADPNAGYASPIPQCYDPDLEEWV